MAGPAWISKVSTGGRLQERTGGRPRVGGAPTGGTAAAVRGRPLGRQAGRRAPCPARRVREASRRAAEPLVGDGVKVRPGGPGSSRDRGPELRAVLTAPLLRS